MSEGEVALVTGGAVRIGRAIALRLGAAGYAVAVHHRRSRDAADALVAEIRAAGGRAAAVRADLADLAEVEALVAQAEAALGPVTLLVNNASEFQADDLLSLTPDLWERHFAVNLRAPAFLARDMARALPADREGAVVNVVDQRVLKPVPQFFSYGLSKAALFAATRTMAQALAPRIRVNAVGPGPALKSERQEEADFARLTEAVPLRRSAPPQDVAEAVLYLARARSVTGQMIAVDAGQHLAWETPDTLVRE